VQQDNSRSNQEISLCFKVAIEKLEKVDAYAKKEKTQIVQDLAKALEGKIPTDRICIEITDRLRNKVSERLIHSCLDEKYKQKRRVENARKRKSKHQITEHLAATLLLEQEKPQQQQLAATQDGKSVIINESSDGIKHSQYTLNGDIIPPSKQKEARIDRKNEVFVSHVPMSFEQLRKDMDTVFQITKGVGNVFFKVSVNLETREIKIEFCGNIPQKNVAMISTGKGILKLRNETIKATGLTSGEQSDPLSKEVEPHR